MSIILALHSHLPAVPLENERNSWCPSAFPSYWIALKDSNIDLDNILKLSVSGKINWCKESPNNTAASAGKFHLESLHKFEAIDSYTCLAASKMLLINPMSQTARWNFRASQSSFLNESQWITANLVSKIQILELNYIASGLREIIGSEKWDDCCGDFVVTKMPTQWRFHCGAQWSRHFSQVQRMKQYHLWGPKAGRLEKMNLASMQPQSH